MNQEGNLGVLTLDQLIHSFDSISEYRTQADLSAMLNCSMLAVDLFSFTFQMRVASPLEDQTCRLPKSYNLRKSF